MPDCSFLVLGLDSTVLTRHVELVVGSDAPVEARAVLGDVDRRAPVFAVPLTNEAW